MGIYEDSAKKYGPPRSVTRRVVSNYATRVWDTVLTNIAAASKEEVENKEKHEKQRNIFIAT